MKTLKLEEFLENNSQTAAAELIGCTQGAVYQMILNKRNILLEFSDDGSFIRAYEVKDLGKTA